MIKPAKKTFKTYKKAGWLLLGVLAGGALLGSRALAGAVSDPWPTSPVLTRLFRLEGKRGGAALSHDLHLDSQKAQELAQLTQLESQSARLADGVTDRLQARNVNTQIAAARQQKDAQARRILGDQYPAFRAWLREWWGREVARSRLSVQARQLVVPTSKVPPEMQ